MKRIFSLILVICLILSAAACGNNAVVEVSESEFGASAAEVSATEPPLISNAFSLPYNTGADYGWNPYTCRSTENQAVMMLMYEGLFALSPSFEPEPCLCESYTVDETGETYTLTIAEALFSDGSQVTVDDVITSMTRARDLEGSIYASRFTDIFNFYALDERNIIIDLNNPCDTLPALLTFPIVKSSSPSKTPTGSGPYVRVGERMQKNSSWWQNKTLTVESITLEPSSSADDTRDLFESGQANLVYCLPSLSSASYYHSDFEQWTCSGTTMQYIGYNMGSYYFSYQSLRQAVSLAVDRMYVSESVYHNYATPASLPAHPASIYYDTSLAEKFDYDETGALELVSQSEVFTVPHALQNAIPTPAPETAETSVNPGESADSVSDSAQDESSTPDDSEADAEADADEETGSTSAEDSESAGSSFNPITMIVCSGNSDRVAAANAVAECLDAVGFTTSVNVLDAGSFLQAISVGNYDLFYAEVVLRPDFDLRPLLTQNGALNYNRVSGSTTSSLIDNSLINRGNRYDLYEHIMNNGMICPVLFENYALFATRGVFETLNPAPGNIFYEPEKIAINDHT